MGGMEPSSRTCPKTAKTAKQRAQAHGVANGTRWDLWILLKGAEGVEDVTAVLLLFQRCPP